MKRFSLQLTILLLQGAFLGALPLYAQPDTLWTSRIIQAGSYNIRVIRTTDSGFAICGGSQYIEGRRDRDFVLNKTDLFGNFEWRAFYEGMPDSVHRNDEAYCICQYPDGGYILGGYSGGFYGMVVRTDSTGEEIWTIYLSNEEGLPEIYAGAIDGENNFVALGRDNSMLLKINADGEIFWNQVYDENGDVFSIARCFDEGYLLTGRSYNYDDRMYDMYAVKIDAAGEIEWENSYDGGFSETCSEAIQTGDSSYCLVGGSRFGVMDSLYAMIVRIDAEGNEIWNRVYNEYRRGDHLTDVVETADGGFAAAGFGDNGETDYLLMRTNSEGEPLWHTFFEGGEYDQCNSLLLMEDGGYLLGGFSGGAWIVRTEPDPANAVWEVDPSFPSVFQINPAYPNPFNSITNISYNLNCNNCVEIVVIDLKGNQVRTLVNGPLQAGYHTEIWDGRNEAGIPVSSGLYFYRISAGNFSKIRKMSLIK